MFKGKNKLKIYLLLALLFVLGTWLVVPYFIFKCFGLPQNAGAFGDAYGTLNSLFTALAFAFLIYTALMQKEELELQRDELQLTRNELEKSAKAQAKLVELTKSQLALQQTIRRNQIVPQLKYLSKKLQPSGPKKYLVLDFEVQENKLRIFEIEIDTQNPELNFKYLDDLKVLHQTKNPGEKINIWIDLNKSDSIPSGTTTIIFHIKDEDQNNYKQILRMKQNRIEMPDAFLAPSNDA